MAMLTVFDVSSLLYGARSFGQMCKFRLCKSYLQMNNVFRLVLISFTFMALMLTNGREIDLGFWIVTSTVLFYVHSAIVFFNWITDKKADENKILATEQPPNNHQN